MKVYLGGSKLIKTAVNYRKLCRPKPFSKPFRYFRVQTTFLNNLLVLLFLGTGILLGTADNAIPVIDLKQVLKKVTVSLRVRSLLLRTGSKIKRRIVVNGRQLSFRVDFQA